MKYTLVPIGEKGPCTCCQREYRLVEDTDGYDLIQFKRGNQVNFGGLQLEPGEPAFVLDTGKFYIGSATGVPILINGGGGQSSSPLATLDSNFESGSLIVVPYADMITADSATPTAADVGTYLSILVVSDNNMPVGQGYLTNWNYSAHAAQFSYVTFHDGHVGQVTFIQATEQKVWTIHSTQWDTSKIVNMEVWDAAGNPLGVQYEIVDSTTVTVTFMSPTAGDAVFYHNVD